MEGIPAVWEHSQERRSSPHCSGNTAPSQSAGIHFACKSQYGNRYENANKNQMQKTQIQTITAGKENFPKPLKCRLDSLVSPEAHQHLLELNN